MEELVPCNCDTEQTPEGQERGADVLRSPATGVMAPRWEKALGLQDHLEPAALAGAGGSRAKGSPGCTSGVAGKEPG